MPVPTASPRRIAMAVVAIGAAAFTQAPAPPPLTPLQVIQKAAAVAVANNQALEDYAWHERGIMRYLDAEGRAKPGKAVMDKTNDVSQVNGVEYDRLIAKDGEPLSAADQAKQDKKQANFIRDHSTPKARAAQLRQQAKDEQQQEAMLREVPNAFAFVFVTPSDPPRCECYVVQATPLPSYHARNSDLDKLHHLAGTLWINRTTFAWERAELHFIQPVNFGWVLLRLSKGSTLVAENASVDGHWFPARLTADIHARAYLLIKGYHLGFEITDFDYRRFQTSVRVLPVPVKH